MKQEVKDMEEKFRKAMVANASLDNEKSQLMFQVGFILFVSPQLISDVFRWTC